MGRWEVISPLVNRKWGGAGSGEREEEGERGRGRQEERGRGRRGKGKRERGRGRAPAHSLDWGQGNSSSKLTQELSQQSFLRQWQPAGERARHPHLWGAFLIQTTPRTDYWNNRFLEIKKENVRKESVKLKLRKEKNFVHIWSDPSLGACWASPWVGEHSAGPFTSALSDPGPEWIVAHPQACWTLREQLHFLLKIQSRYVAQVHLWFCIYNLAWPRIWNPSASVSSVLALKADATQPSSDFC